MQINSTNKDKLKEIGYVCNMLVPMSDTWRCLVEPAISTYTQRTNASQSERVCESLCQGATFSCAVVLEWGGADPQALSSHIICGEADGWGQERRDGEREGVNRIS